MEALNEDSGTGPDELPALILKRCAEALGTPIAMLALQIIATGYGQKLGRFIG